MAFQQNSLTAILSDAKNPLNFHVAIICIVIWRVNAVVVVNFGITFFWKFIILFYIYTRKLLWKFSHLLKLHIFVAS
jgi:hypothetical protein